MCKPVIQDIPVRTTGPCSFSVRSFSHACAAFTLGSSWRQTVANVLRRWADRAEGTRSIVIVAYGPPQIVWSDVADSLSVGINGATTYLNDLWRDRVYGATDATVIGVASSKAVR